MLPKSNQPGQLYGTQKHINLRDRTLSKIFHGPHNIFLCSPLVILS